MLSKPTKTSCKAKTVPLLVQYTKCTNF